MGVAQKTWLLFALAAALSWPTASARKPAAPSTVQDLVYGEILFEFYQERYLEAITLQLAATRRGTLNFHAEESELLSGGMYLAYGQQNQAEAIFDRLLDKRASPEVRQQARLQLARSHYRRGSFERAVELLETPDWNDELRDKARTLAAGSLLGLGAYDRAEIVLRDLQRSDDAAFARYNLGVALAGQGSLDEATRQLRRVGDLAAPARRGLFRRGKTTDTALPALRDKARLALGYALIRNGQADEAMQALEGIDLDGPYASAALLGAGWAAAEMRRYDVALNAWQVLQQRDPADPAVQEAWFAVPYALGELAAHGQAAAAFEVSIQQIEKEDRALLAAIDHLGREGMASLLLAADSDARWDAGWRLGEAPDHPLSRYLFLLMADNVFQQHLRDFRDLRALMDLLNRKRSDFDNYRHMIDARDRRFALHEPLARGVVDGSRLDGLRDRAAALQTQVAAIAGGNDYLRLADAEERDQLARLDELILRIDVLPPAQAQDLRERRRVLHGLLRWRLSADFAGRMHRLQRELAAVEAELAETLSRKEKLAAALQAAPADNALFAQRLENIIPRIAQTQLHIAATLEQTDRRLVDLATGELQQRRARLAQYLDQARYALAAIHDRAAAEGS